MLGLRGGIMKTLIIYAHPETDGHNAHVLSEVEKNLKNKNISYEVLDLYKMKYDSILHETEHYTTGNREVSAENKTIQKKILDSDHIIFIYPMWWGSMPAILKGFIDRVFVSHFAFKYVGGRPVGLLKPRTATVFVTSGGKRFIYTIFRSPKRVMQLAILRFCGIRSKYIQIYDCTQLNYNKKQEIKKIVEKTISKLTI